MPSSDISLTQMAAIVRPFLFVIAIGIISASVCSSCLTAQDQDGASQKTDAAEQKIKRQDPFKIRPFSPVAGEYKGREISYGPFRAGQRPGEKGPTREQVKEDLVIIAKDKWQMIRTYGTEPFSEKVCEVIRTEKLPIKLMLGAWIETEKNIPAKKQSNVNQVELAIKLANKYPDVVAAVSVANESQVFWSFHKVNTDTLIQYIRQVRSAIKQPVTVADDFKYWSLEESKKLANELDFIVTHAYAMWLGQQLEDSLAFTKTQYGNVKSMHPKKVVVLGEFGWATKVANHGEQAKLIKGKPGIEQQKKFFDEHMNWLSKKEIPFFYFEAFDEPWKGGDDPNEVEKHWGLYFESRIRK